MSENDPEGGDPACWVALVCPECGAVRDTTDPHVPCPRCGAAENAEPEPGPPSAPSPKRQHGL